MKKYHLLTGMFLLSLAAAPLEAADNGQTRAEIEAATKKWLAAFNQKDIPALLEFYTEDAQRFGPEAGISKGHEEIRESLELAVKYMVEITESLTTLDVFPHGEFATETGTWTDKHESRPRSEEGTYMALWQKKNGTWKMHREIWNTTRRSVELAEPLKVVERLAGTWVHEGKADGQPVRVSITGKPVAGGAGILSEGTVWVNDKLAEEWADLTYWQPESKRLASLSISASEQTVSQVEVSPDRIVFHETGFAKDGTPIMRLTELVLQGERKMQLNQRFHFREGKPVDRLLQGVEMKRVD